MEFIPKFLEFISKFPFLLNPLVKGGISFLKFLSLHSANSHYFVKVIMTIYNHLKACLVQLITLVFFSFLVNSVQAYWVSDFDIPPKDKQNSDEGGAFHIGGENEKKYLTYIAATKEKPIRLNISKGFSAFLKITIPPGISSLNMPINSAHLAGSQTILFKNFGEYVCDDVSIFPPTSKFIGNDYCYEKDCDNSGWEPKTGAKTLHHERDELKRDELNLNSDSCVVFGFHNYDNRALFQLQEVSVTYTISDLEDFGKWANKLTVKVEGDGTVSGGKITNCSSSVVCETNYLETTNLTATTNTGTKVLWEGNSCVEDPNDNFKATVNYNKDIGSDTCHVKFLAPLTVQVTGIGSVTGTGIDCNENGVLCTADFLAGVPVHLTANRADAVWGGSCSDNGQIKNVITGIEPCVVTFPAPEIEISVDDIPVEMGGVVTFTADKAKKTLTIKNVGGLPLTLSSLQYPAGFNLTTLQLLLDDGKTSKFPEEFPGLTSLTGIERSSEVLKSLPPNYFSLAQNETVLFGIQLDAEMDEHLGSFILETDDNDASPFTLVLYYDDEEPSDVEPELQAPALGKTGFVLPTTEPPTETKTQFFGGVEFLGNGSKFGADEHVNIVATIIPNIEGEDSLKAHIFKLGKIPTGAWYIQIDLGWISLENYSESTGGLKEYFLSQLNKQEWPADSTVNLNSKMIKLNSNKILLNVFSGKFENIGVGSYEFYVGYRLEDGTIVYNAANPITFTVE